MVCSWGHGTILKKAWELDHLKSWEYFFPRRIFWSVTYVKLKSASHCFRFPQSLQKVKAYSNGSKIKLWDTLQSPFKITSWHTRIDSNPGQEGLPWRLSQQEIHLQHRRPRFGSLDLKVHMPGNSRTKASIESLAINPALLILPLEFSKRRKWQATPVFLPGESRGQRSLAGIQPTGLQRLRPDWVTKHTRMQARRIGSFS